MSVPTESWAELSNNVFTAQNVIILFIFLVVTWDILCLLFWQRSSIPGPRGYPIIGNFLDVRDRKHFVNLLEKWEKTYGPIVGFRPAGIFGPRTFLIVDAEVYKQILVTNSSNGHRPDAPKHAFGKGVFWSNGKEHARQRRMIHPIFRVNNLKGMMEVFKRKTKLFIEVLSETIQNSEQEETCFYVQKDLPNLTLDIIGECAFGHQFDSITKGRSTTLSSVFKAIAEQTFYKTDTQALAISVVKKIISEKKRKAEGNENRNVKDLLDLLMNVSDDETGQRMNERELYSQIFTFLVAGHETTTITITWTLHFLAKNPEIQEKLREEINETIQDETTEWETYESMPYLNAVINESLRICPPAAIFRRKVIKDDNILGYQIPAGSILLLSPYLIHRSDYWEDPETFNPDRFLNQDNSDSSHGYTFLPFSKGPRTCIGNKFALMEMKVVLSMLVKSFSFSSIPGQSVKGVLHLLYRPDPPLELLVRRL